MSPVLSSHRVKNKVHEGIDVNESEPNIKRRRLVAHPSRSIIKVPPAEIKAFLLEPIDASDQLMSKHFETIKWQ